MRVRPVQEVQVLTSDPNILMKDGNEIGMGLRIASKTGYGLDFGPSLTLWATSKDFSTGEVTANALYSKLRQLDLAEGDEVTGLEWIERWNAKRKQVDLTVVAFGSVVGGPDRSDD